MSSFAFPYQRIVDYFRQGIECGDFPPGSQLPSQQQLGETFGVSRAPVLKALGILSNEGLIRSVQGLGAFVVHRAAASYPNGNEVALLLPHATFHHALVRALQDTLFDTGYLLRIYVTAYREQRERAYVEHAVKDASVCGLLLSPQSAPHKMKEFYPALLSDVPKPIILINRRIQDTNIDFVEYDYVQGGRMLADHLLRLGHKRVIFYGIDPRRTSWEPRLRGLRSRFQEEGIDPLVDCFPMGLGPVLIRRLSARLKAREADVIVSADDAHATYLYDFLIALGQDVPGDIAVVSFDDREFSRYMSPPLTTIAPAKAEAGRLAAEALIRKIEDPTHSVHVSLPCKLIVRASCGSPETATHMSPFSDSYADARPMEGESVYSETDEERPENVASHTLAGGSSHAAPTSD